MVTRRKLVTRESRLQAGLCGTNDSAIRAYGKTIGNLHWLLGTRGRRRPLCWLATGDQFHAGKVDRHDSSVGAPDETGRNIRTNWRLLVRMLRPVVVRSQNRDSKAQKDADVENRHIFPLVISLLCVTSIFNCDIITERLSFIPTVELRPDPINELHQLLKFGGKATPP